MVTVMYVIPEWRLFEVQRLLEENGLDSSLLEVSKRSNIKYGTLRKYNCGDRKPSDQSKRKMANLYEMLKQQFIKGDLYGSDGDDRIDIETITGSCSTG